MTVVESVSPYHRQFLRLARFIAQEWSHDPSTQTGAVVVDPYDRVVGLDCNRLPRGVTETSELLNDRSQKYPRIVHCERAAMMTAGDRCRGSVLYTWPFMSCAICAQMVIEMGIIRCVAPIAHNERWQADWDIAGQMFEESTVELILVDPKVLDEES